MHDRLKDSISGSPVLYKNGYPYLIHPVTDGIPSMDPDVLEEITDWMIDTGDFDCDLILAPEAMGIPLAVSLSVRLKIPYTVMRKRKYSLPGEMEIINRTGYSESRMYINGVSEGQRVAVVDDVISTGGTMKSVVGALKGRMIDITDILVVFNKGSGKEEIEREFGIRVKTMLRIDFKDGKPVCFED